MMGKDGHQISYHWVHQSERGLHTRHPGSKSNVKDRTSQRRRKNKAARKQRRHAAGTRTR